MRPGIWVPFCLFCLSACDSGTAEMDDSGDLSDTDLTNDTDDTSDTAAVWEPYPSSFTEGRYRVTKLQLSTEADTDDDGVIDNNLVNLFNAIDLLVSTVDLSTESFNALMQENLGLWVTNVLIEAINDEGLIDFRLYNGIADSSFNLSIDPNSVDASGAPIMRLDGAFTTEQAFFAGPGPISIPVVFFAGEAPSMVQVEQALFDGVLNDTQTAGVITGAFPTDDLLENVIDPILDPEGADIDGDGSPETKEEILELIEALLPQAGDVDLGDGNVGISVRFSFVAQPADF